MQKSKISAKGGSAYGGKNQNYKSKFKIFKPVPFNLSKFVSLIVLFVSLLFGFGLTPLRPILAFTPTPTMTVAPTATRAPTPTRSGASPTPRPPTNTPRPTNTPTLTPRPATPTPCPPEGCPTPAPTETPLPPPPTLTPRPPLPTSSPFPTRTPTPSPSPTPYATPTLRCYPPEWICKDEDVQRPEVECCPNLPGGRCLPIPIDPPYECPTNQDEGQKDGTGKSGNLRRYRFFDYDVLKTVEVPPAIGIGTAPPEGPSSCTPSGWPVGGPGNVTLSFQACHPSEGCHSGIDIATYQGDAVRSTIEGTVTYLGYSGGYGNTVEVTCNEFKTSFSHLDSFGPNVALGARIQRGMEVGKEGKSGNVAPVEGGSGVHLHYRLWRNGVLVNPGDYLNPPPLCVGWGPPPYDGFCAGGCGSNKTCPASYPTTAEAKAENIWQRMFKSARDFLGGLNQ